MNYPDWLKTVPVEIRGDPLWNQEACRLALFAADLGWHDTTRLFRDGRTLKLASQLFEAVGSAGANISEGYSRGYPKDRARFYEYALGSARESRTWYFDGRHVLGDALAHHRIQLHTQIIRLLLKMLPPTRGYALHDGDSEHFAGFSDAVEPMSASELQKLLEIVPIPLTEITEHGTRSTDQTTRNPLLALAVAAPLLLCSPSPAADWPQFRGPTGDGSAAHADPPIVWSETANIAWKVHLNGRGRSSPILLGNRLWLTAAVEQGVVRTNIKSDDMQTAEHVSLRTVCVDAATGKNLWEAILFDVPHPDPVHWLNSWATPTPVAEPGRVYCDFGTYGTVCLDAATGKVLWKQQLRLDHQVGPGSSPVLWRDRLFLVRDGRDAQYVAALDKNTGQTLWKTERPPLTGSSGELKKSFCTPLVLQQGEQVQVIAPGAQWAVAYDPLLGKEIWRVHHGRGFSIGTSPVFAQGLVYFGTGCFKPQLWAVRVDGHDDVTESHVAWKSLRQVPVMSSPTLAGDEIFWVSDDGMATCADASNGEIHWQERLGGPCLASPLLAQGRLYFFRQDATTIVIKAGRQFERLSENPLEGILVATPALGDHALYLRTDAHLYCIRH